MKIVNLKTFRELPPNTVFAKYEPCVFEELQIKGETWDFDFISSSILEIAGACNSDARTELLRRAEQTDESLAMDFDHTGRDGCFEDDQLFAVWEEADVRALIERLKLCLANAPAEGRRT